MWRSWNPYSLLVGMYNGVAIVENNLDVPQKVKHRIAIWSSNSTPRYVSQIIESKDSNRYLNIDIHSSIIHSSQKVDKTQMSNNRWKDKQNVIYTYNGILFSLKKKWNSNTCHNIEPKDTMLSEISQKQKSKFHLYKVLK